MLNEAIEALKAGDKEKAFGLLRQHLAANPKDAAAWLWMSEAASEPAQQIDALQQVLRLAPDHSRAPMIQRRLQLLLHTTSPQPTLSRVSSPSPQSVTEIEQRAGEGLRARLRREGASSPSLEQPIRTEEPVVDLDDWLRAEVEPETHATATPPMSEFRVEPPAVAPTLTPAVDDSPLPQTPPLSPMDSLPMAASLRAEAAAQTSPLPRPTPPQDDKMPGWVWGIMLLSLILVAAFIFFAWKATTGS